MSALSAWNFDYGCCCTFLDFTKCSFPRIWVALFTNVISFVQLTRRARPASGQRRREPRQRTPNVRPAEQALSARKRQRPLMLSKKDVSVLATRYATPANGQGRQETQYRTPNVRCAEQAVSARKRQQTLMLSKNCKSAASMRGATPAPLP